MGCGGIKESSNNPSEKDEEEKKEEKSDKPKKKSEKKKDYNFDDHKIKYFKNFDEEEISLIMERKKLVEPDINFVFLYSKFEVDYTDKELNKTNSAICKEYLVCYVNPEYTGDFGYHSQLVGFCLDKVSLNYCSIQNKQVPTQMRNTGKIVSVLQIEESYKDDIIKDIMVFEFEFNITQLKKYGMRVIDIYYDEKPMTSSILIKYNKNIFNIKSSVDADEDSKNKFYIFNKDKFCIVLIDKNNDLSIKKNDNKIGKLIYDKFSEDEIKEINKSLNNMFIRPYEKNIIYEKMIHNLTNNKDCVKGYILIFYPSFDKDYFDLCEGIDKTPDKVDFLINELKVNDELLINIKKTEGKNIKPENYYESTINSHKYNIRIEEDFILFEFELEGIPIEEDKDEIQYSLDAKYIFNFFLNCDTAYKFEIILNKHEVYFKDDKTYKYKYKKTKEIISFEGIWKLKEWNNKKSKKYLPNEIIIKKQ